MLLIVARGLSLPFVPCLLLFWFIIPRSVSKLRRLNVCMRSGELWYNCSETHSAASYWLKIRPPPQSIFLSADFSVVQNGWGCVCVCFFHSNYTHIQARMFLILYSLSGRWSVALCTVGSQWMCETMLVGVKHRQEWENSLGRRDPLVKERSLHIQNIILCPPEK